MKMPMKKMASMSSGWWSDSEKPMGNFYKVPYKEQEIYRHHPKSQRVIIFIHGIIEGPKQFRHLAQIAYEEGYSVYVLLLPGHGKSGEAFGETCYREWINYVTKQIKLMKERYKELILVGHSMGALLAICESACFPKQVKALVLMDTPLVLRLWPRVIKGAVKIVEGRGEVADRYTRAEYHAISVAQTTGHGYIKWAMRYLELFTLIRYTKKQIPKVNLPILLVFAKKDEFVSLMGKYYFKEKYLTELLLMDSGHFCYHHEDLLQLETAFKQFIRQQKKSSREKLR